MRNESISLLKKLVETPGPSGHEAVIQSVVREYMAPYCDTISTDVHGNLIGAIKPDATPRVMLSAHCDEVGLMVTHIDERGFAYCSAIGGVDPCVAAGQRVLVHTADGPVTGVVGRLPVHLMEKEAMDKAPRLHELWLDIGAATRDDAATRIEIGNPVTFDVGFKQLSDGLAVGRALDDRGGIFVMLESLRLLDRKNLNTSIFAVSTVQEEIGHRGAITSTFGIAPDIGIAVDVGPATDYPTADPRKIGDFRIGAGPILHTGPNIHAGLGHLLMKTASSRNIHYQLRAEPRGTPTDANAIQLSRAGVATALVRIPCRYLHTPVEMLSLNDLENAANLLAAFIEQLNSDTLKPGEAKS
jgi:putative aminopeptidase FrvX